MQNTTFKTSKRVAIIGGGIAGLSTAWYLQKRTREEGLDLQYALLECSDRWGGKIFTETIEELGGQPFIVEGGPDSFLTQKPWAVQLARELGLGDRLLGTNDDMRKVFVLNKSRPTPLPDGVLLIVPTKIGPFVLSPLLSPLGKLRMGLDLFIPAKRDGQDETVAEFITRRLGNEALDKIAEPLMSGIYNAEAERQSLLATFPRFRDLEEKHGSLIKGMLASQRARRKGAGPKNTTESSRHSQNQQKLSMFVSLTNGTQELVGALIDSLEGNLQLNSAVNELERRDDHYRLTLSDGNHLEADAVILAVPSYIAAQIIQPLAPDAAAGLENIRYVSTGTISLAFRRKDVDLLKGFGLVIPRSEQRLVNAVTLTSTKFDHRAPDDHVLLRVFFGGSRHPQMMDIEDNDLLAIVLGELKELLGIEARPVFHRIYRWQRANPQYDVGHLERVADIEEALPAGIHVTGSPYRGIGIPDCVHQGQQTANQVIKQLQARSEKDLMPSH